ncbi:MAG: tetratricopeptide repeat protein [Chthoniobacterales bacterium]
MNLKRNLTYISLWIISCVMFLFYFGNTLAEENNAPFLSAGDLKKSPSPEQIRELCELPPDVASKQICSILFPAYRPSKKGQKGICFDSNYQQWTNLAAWFALLSHSERSEVLRFLSYKIFERPDGKLFYITAGESKPGDALPVKEPHHDQWLQGLSQAEKPWSFFIKGGYTTGSGILNDLLSSKLKYYIASHPEILSELLNIWSLRDFSPKVLKNLEEIYTKSPKDFELYHNLAIAIAVVYDENFPQSWPHHQVSQADVPLADLQALQVFDFWVQADKSGKLYMKLSELTTEQIKFIIDAPIQESEFFWALNNSKFPKGNFGKAFSSITYSRERLLSGAFDWPERTPYTLENIRKFGGICVDQAYYAMLSGKAFGLPTLFFVGQGADGGHAWFGYMKGINRWDMNVGRYETQKYAVGEALDPQTWQAITDHEIDFLAKQFRSSKEFQASLTDLRIAALALLNNKKKEASIALQSAIDACPQNENAWSDKGQFIHQEEGAVATAKFWEEAAKAFPSNRSMESVFLNRAREQWQEAGEMEKSDVILKNLIALNRTQRPDISITLVAEKINQLLAKDELKTAYDYYRTEFPKLARFGGGDLFYKVVVPLATAFKKSGDQKQANKVIDVAKREFRAEEGSILDRELKKLSIQIDA